MNNRINPEENPDCGCSGNLEESPLVSVIIPVYNAGEYLDECLRNICNQSYRNLEIIAVNDGSTDNSILILNDWGQRDDRLRIIDIPNGGVSNARNRGISESRGPILMFVDSDDILWERSIEILYNSMARNRTSISCGLLCYHKNQLGHPAIYTEKVLDSETVAEGLLYQTSDVIVHPGAQIFKRSLFSSPELMYPVGQTYEDLDLIPRIYMETDRISICEVNIYYYRQHDNSFVHTFSPRRFDSIKAVESLDRHLSHRSKRLAEAVQDRIMSASFNAFLLSSGHPEYQDLNNECWRRICGQRRKSLLNPKVRLKNKIGVMVSYAGPGILRWIGKLMKNR